MTTLPDHPALRSALLTYLGNKRRLLPLVWRGLHAAGQDGGPLQTLADPFTGSGVVARMGRLAGLSVTAGDIEDYTGPGSRAFLELDPRRADELLAPGGGYAAVLEHLNQLRQPRNPDGAYFARHYAPADTAHADPDRERMFYTRENALRLDAMLEEIHGSYRGHARDLLLAGVLVKMSIHNNTSGVMKGFHRGWGGRGGDALNRIMAPIELEPLPLITGAQGRAFVCAADQLPGPRGGGGYDVAYLDPPYTTHQYGANYHLLTSAVRHDFWDPGPVRRGRRAGIRSDHYRSEHCRRGGTHARDALARVLESIAARVVLVSYNDDGILAPPEMVQLLAGDGSCRVELLEQDYHAFRGGKATGAAVGTRELLFVVRRGLSQSARERGEIVAYLTRRMAERELHRRFLLPDRWLAAGGRLEADERGYLARWGTGVRLHLDTSLRVRRVTLPDEAPPESPLRELQQLTDGSLVTALESALAAQLSGSVLALLPRLKVRKYHAARSRLLPAIRRLPLSDAQRRRLEDIVARMEETEG